MHRSALARLTLTVLACLAVSMDSATKVLHGFAHQRQSIAHELHESTHASAAPSTVNLNGVALDAPDDDDDHGVLHQVAASNILSKAPLAVSATAQIPLWHRIAQDARLDCPSTRTASFFVHTGPDQPRAPPVG